MGHHTTKEGDFSSDKYRILRIDDLEKLRKEEDWRKIEVGTFASDKIPQADKNRLYNQALEDIKKLSEDVSLNKIVLSFKDKAARLAVRTFANYTTDLELGKDILEVLNNWKE